MDHVDLRMCVNLRLCSLKSECLVYQLKSYLCNNYRGAQNIMTNIVYYFEYAEFDGSSHFSCLGPKNTFFEQIFGYNLTVHNLIVNKLTGLNKSN